MQMQGGVFIRLFISDSRNHGGRIPNFARLNLSHEGNRIK